MEVISHKSRIDALGGHVLLVTYDTPELLRSKMMHDLEIPFPLLLDPQKSAYGRWCSGRTTLRESVFSPTLSFRYAKLLVRGERFLGLAPDMLQLGGDFVVDPQGKIAFAHAMKNNGDRAAVESLIIAMEQSRLTP